MGCFLYGLYGAEPKVFVTLQKHEAEGYMDAIAGVLNGDPIDRKSLREMRIKLRCALRNKKQGEPE